MSKGWVKLRRSLVDWEWYDDHNATRLLIHLLCSVNYEDKKWRGIVIKKGSMALSWDTLSSGSRLSKQQCRTAMTKLESSGEVTRYLTAKFQVITLVKWEKFQKDEREVTPKLTGNLTGNQQGDNRQVTPTKETNNIKNIKNIEERKLEFASTLSKFKDKYSSDFLKEFYEYWTEPSKGNTKFRQEMEKTWGLGMRLARWESNNNKFSSSRKNGSHQETSTIHKNR